MKINKTHRPVNRPIAAHFRSGGLEFLCFGEDLGESVCEPVEASACLAVWERTPEHQHEVLGPASAAPHTHESPS
jgi:hypothetical protein